MCNKELIGIHDHGVKVVPSPKGPRPNAFLPGGMAHRGNLTEGEIVAAFKSGYLVPRPPAEQAAEIATLRAANERLQESFIRQRDCDHSPCIEEADTLRAALDKALGYLDKISPSGYHVEHAREILIMAKEKNK